MSPTRAMTGIFAAALTVAALAPNTVRSAGRPNIMFVMSDDHTYQAIGAYGSRLAPLNPTPTIDTLATEGMLFEAAFCSNSICAPSRATIMTGQYAHVNGALDLGGRVKPEHQYLAIEMKKAGYQTAIVGKWHLKERPEAFDYYKVLPGQGKYFNPEFYEKGKQGKVRMTGHSSDCIADEVLKWLKSREKNQPFFLKLHFKAPHDMFQNARRYETYLADVNIPEPESLWQKANHGSIATRGHNDELVRYIGTSIGRRNIRRNYTQKWARDPSLTDEQAKRHAYQTYLKKYLRCVKGVDDNLRRVFDYLKQEGIFDNTVIFYTGDQGFMLGEHDYQDKRWGYEESMRMPLLVRYPKTIKAGSHTDAIVENVDYAPTMLDFAGVETPSYMQGRSLKPILETGREPTDWKQAAYYQYWMHMAHHDNPAHIGMRTKRYKLILFYGADGDKQRTPPGWELYDLKTDPKEMNNVYDNPEYAGVLKKLKQQFKELRTRIRADDPELEENTRIKTANEIIEEFWDYDAADRAKAIAISKGYVEKLKNRPGRRQGSTRRGKPAKVDKDGWIQPLKSKTPLREHAGCIEVSRNAGYKISHPGPAHFNLDNAYLVSVENPPNKPHAFHSVIDATRPSITIKLDKTHSIRFLKIRNRRKSHQERATGLTVWTSTDGKTWSQAWQAKSVQDEWTIDLVKETRAAYIKIGLPETGTLHLNQVVVFGK